MREFIPFASNLRDALPNASFIGFTGTPIEKTDVNMLLHGVKDTDSELSLGMLVGAVYSPIIAQMLPPLILPMDFRLMPRSQARVDVAQPHCFPEFLQAPWQPVRDIWAVF